MTEILACVDLANGSDAVLGAARTLANGVPSNVHLVHVAAGEPALAGYDAGPVTAHSRDDRAVELTAEHRQLRELAEAWSDPDLNVIPLLVMGPTIDQILHEAERLDVATIVLGRHSHGRLHHMVLGSVSEGVVRHANRPVLVVPLSGP